MFAFAGPLIAGPIVCLLMLCYTQFEPAGDGWQGFARELPQCAVTGPLFGYIVGFVPAALAGTVLAIVLPSAGRRHLLWATALAGVVSLAAGGLLVYDHATPAEDQPEALAFAGAAALAGLIAGQICWRVLYPRRSPQAQGA